jgi:hypothetical protein
LNVIMKFAEVDCEPDTAIVCRVGGRDSDVPEAMHRLHDRFFGRG